MFFPSEKTLQYVKVKRKARNSKENSLLENITNCPSKRYSGKAKSTYKNPVWHSPPVLEQKLDNNSDIVLFLVTLF